MTIPINRQHIELRGPGGTLTIGWCGAGVMDMEQDLLTRYEHAVATVMLDWHGYEVEWVNGGSFNFGVAINKRARSSSNSYIETVLYYRSDDEGSFKSTHRAGHRTGQLGDVSSHIVSLLEEHLDLT